MGEFRLGVDYGTSHTVAVLAWPDGRTRPLLFDGSTLLPSAVAADGDGGLLTGAEALRAARVAPASAEPNPKRRITDGDVLLGERSYPVASLIAATLRTVAEEAARASPGGGGCSTARTRGTSTRCGRTSARRRRACRAGRARSCTSPSSTATSPSPARTSRPPPDRCSNTPLEAGRGLRADERPARPQCSQSGRRRAGPRTDHARDRRPGLAPVGTAVIRGCRAQALRRPLRPPVTQHPVSPRTPPPGI